MTSVSGLRRLPPERRPRGTAARSRIVVVSPSFVRMAAPLASPKQFACEAALRPAPHSIALVPLCPTRLPRA